MLDLKLTDMRFMYLTELRGKDICVLEEVNTTKGNAGGCGEAGQVLSLAVLFCLAKISVYAYKKNCKGKGYCKGMGIRVRSETYKIGGGFRVQKHVGGIILR